MEVKEAFVTRENPNEIFSIIEDFLSSNINTQVFVDEEIYEELKSDGPHYFVRNQNYLKRFHYYHNQDNCGGEDWLSLMEDYNNEIARASFISNCKGYKQLVEFNSSKVKRYVHYLKGFEQLLLIQFETES